MPQEARLASHIAIFVDGTEIEGAVFQELLEVVVDQHAHLPAYFSIRLKDKNLSLLDEGPFDLTKGIEIKAETGHGDQHTIIKGEITALEPHFNEGMMAELVVQGYDPSHRLFRQPHTRAHLNKKDSDLANEIAQEAGLSTEIENTQIVYEHIFQHNQTDLEFLSQRAWRIGYECFVKEGKLFFRKPPQNGQALNLTWGSELVSFRPRMTLAEQVDEVVVKGWDIEKKEAWTGRAANGGLFPGIQENKNGKEWASSFGPGKKILVDQSVVSQAEADQLAAARMDEISGAFIEAQGVVFRRPDIQTGKFVQLDGLGRRLSGSYLVTKAQHVFTADGLRTFFEVRGTRTGLISEQLSRSDPMDRWPGVAPAIVTNTDDPSGWGRIKIKFPWMADDAESAWCRLVAPGAGPEAGFLSIPEVGDEVLVSFAHGDFGQPYVLGGLWNGQHDLPPEVSQAGSSEKPMVRTWRSRSGHLITFYDNGKNKIEIISANGHQVILDDQNKKILIVSNGGQKIQLDDQRSKITLESSGEVEIKSSTNMKIKAGANLDLEASGNVTIKGSTIQLN